MFDIVSVGKKRKESDYSRMSPGGGSDESDELLYYNAQPNSVAKSIIELETQFKTKMGCPSCGKLYKIKTYYEMHVEHCGKELNVQCEHCSFKTNNEKSLKFHTVLKHPEIKAAVKSKELLMCCPKCGSAYENEVMLYNHMNYCKRQATFQCSFCPHTTKSASSLRIHIYYRHPDNEASKESDDPKLVCPGCGKNCSTKEHLHGHRRYCRRTHLQCATCPFKTKTKWHLSKHINDRHLKEHVFEGNIRGPTTACPKCGRKYSYKTSLSRHLTTCGKKKPELQCELCSYKCCKQVYLDLHVIRNHLIDDSNSN